VPNGEKFDLCSNITSFVQYCIARFGGAHVPNDDVDVLKRCPLNVRFTSVQGVDLRQLVAYEDELLAKLLDKLGTYIDSGKVMPNSNEFNLPLNARYTSAYSVWLGEIAEQILKSFESNSIGVREHTFSHVVPTVWPYDLLVESSSFSRFGAQPSVQLDGNCLYTFEYIITCGDELNEFMKPIIKKMPYKKSIITIRSGTGRSFTHEIILLIAPPKAMANEQSDWACRMIQHHKQRANVRISWIPFAKGEWSTFKIQYSTFTKYEV